MVGGLVGWGLFKGAGAWQARRQVKHSIARPSRRLPAAAARLYCVTAGGVRSEVGLRCLGLVPPAPKRSLGVSIAKRLDLPASAAGVARVRCQPGPSLPEMGALQSRHQQLRRTPRTLEEFLYAQTGRPLTQLQRRYRRRSAQLPCFGQPLNLEAGLQNLATTEPAQRRAVLAANEALLVKSQAWAKARHRRQLSGWIL